MSESSMVTRLLGSAFNLPHGWRLLVSAIAAAVPFYFAAFLSASVARASQLGKPLSLGVHAAVFLVLLTIVVLAAKYVTTVHDQLKTSEQARLALRLHAYTHLDRLILQDTRRVNNGRPVGEDFMERFVASHTALQEIVEAAYAACEAAYGKCAKTEDRVDFEVTFMTKSYKDGWITIPACANRDGRAPRSMVMRQQDPEIYERTVTAAVYRDDRPSIGIIEDTASPETKYQQLYPNQIDRIRSSVVFPVLSNTNVLLGTLVVHCDRAHFFRHGDEKYWTDLFEIFAKRLALAKLKLDMVVRLSSPVSIPPPALPF